MTTPRKIWIGLSAVVGLALLAIPTYQPLKFYYVIWRIESATTIEQEKAACILASRVGHVWEVNDIHPGEFGSRVFPTRVGQRAKDVVTEIEWLENPCWRGMEQPYRAYRVLLDPKNRDYLVARSK